MVAGITLKEAIKAVGTDGRTQGQDLIAGLKVLGIKCSSKSVTYRNGAPERAILRYKGRSAAGPTDHWVVLWNGLIADPMWPGAVVAGIWIRESTRKHGNTGRFTSYVEIL